MVIGQSNNMCLTNKIFLQTHVTFCDEYLVFHEFKRNLYITLANLEQEGHIADWDRLVCFEINSF